MTPTALRALLVSTVEGIAEVERRRGDRFKELRRGVRPESAPDRTFILRPLSVPNRPSGQGLQCRDRYQEFELIILYQASQEDLADRVSEDGLLVINALNGLQAAQAEIHECVVDQAGPIDWEAGEVGLNFHVQFTPG